MNSVKNLVLDVPSEVVHPKSEVNHTIHLDAGITNAVLPNYMSCLWTLADGTVRAIYYGDIADLSIIVRHTYGVSTRGVQIVSANCSNTVTYQMLEANVIFLMSIDNVTIDVYGYNYIATNSPGSFVINATYGEVNITYEAKMGDGTLVVKHTPHHHDFVFQHTYTAEGVYSVNLVTFDKASQHTSDSPNVMHVQNVLQTINLAFNTYGLIPDGRVNYSIQSTATAPPTNVSCLLTFRDGQAESFYIDSWASTTLFTTYHNYGDQDTHDLLAKVNCSNEVSQTEDTKIIVLHALITHLTITADMKFVDLNQNVTFFINASTGSNVTYVIDYGDSNSEEYPVDTTLVLNVKHAYAAIGKYNVTVTAFSIYQTEREVLAHLVEVQTLVDDLILVSDSPRSLPNGVTTFTLSTVNQAYVPVGVTIIWNFGDGYNVSENENGLPTGHMTLHTYETKSIGDVLVYVKAYNAISSKDTNTTVRVVQIITEPNITADKYHARVNETVTFSPTLQNGSHINYTIHYNDTFSELVTWVDETTVLNRDHTFVHFFTESGLYWVNFQVQNIFNSESAMLQTAVKVEHILPPIELGSPSPVLTPPGHIHIVLSTQAIMAWANDVTCLWNYGCDVTQCECGCVEQTQNYPQFVLPIHWHFKYEPNATTFMPLLNTSVYCNNFIHSSSNFTLVEIKRNDVILEYITDSGPVEPNEPLTFTLHITNYANNTCFYWNFTTVGKMVVFGEEHCKTFRVSAGSSFWGWAIFSRLLQHI